MQVREVFILLAFLILGAALRFQGQAEISQILHHDEAYYGLDALSLLENPRLQVFFPANTGREGLWMYLLTPMLATIGATPLALHLTSAFVGIATIAALYWLAREVYEEGAVWAAGAISVLYWHVHLSHIGFRMITFPLFGALAFAALFRAIRLNRGWWLVGLFFALLLHSYVAASVYVAFGSLWLLGLGIWKGRKGAFLALGILLVLAIPLALAHLNPGEGAESINRVAASGSEQIWLNIKQWARAWLERGDTNSTHNLPRRPILDMPLLLLTLIGFVGAWFIVRKRWMLLWWLGLVLVSFVPTIFSIEAPHFLRGSGLIIPLALLIGAGAAAISHLRLPPSSPQTPFSLMAKGGQNVSKLHDVKSFPLNEGDLDDGKDRHFISPKLLLGLNLWLIPFLLIFWAGWNTYGDFQQWLENHSPRFGIDYDYRLNAGMSIIASESPPDSPIMLAGLRFNPNAAFLAAGLQRPITFYEWPDDTACYLSPRQPYTMLDLPMVLDSFSRRVQPYTLQLETVFAHPENEFNVYLVEPLPELIEDWESPLLGDVLQMRVLPPTNATIRAGETLEIYLGLRVSGEFARQDYRILAHLQGDPSPYEGGTLYSTGDEAICPLAYGISGDFTLVQRLALPIPADLPVGDYHLALGIYEPAGFSRLPLSPAENEHGYFVGWAITVLE